LRLREGGDYTTITLSPRATRAALAAYLPAIPVEPSPFAPPERRALAADERRGLSAFRARCSGCHQLLPATGAEQGPAPSALEPMLRDARLVLTSALRYDVGTPVLGEGGNCPPSLRGVWSAAPYFSDGSAATIEDVLRRTDPAARAVHAPSNAQRPPAIPAQQRAELAAFLRVL
jgi:cytochrome c peroxidase